MDNQNIEFVLTSLKKKEETHPIFCKLWKNYINLKISSLNKEINQLKSVLEDMDKNTTDLQIEQIQLLICMNQINNT